MRKALILTSKLVQDHEFIYPFYRLKEAGFNVETCNLSDGIVEGFFGTKVPPQATDTIVNIKKINVDNYDILILPGGVKSMEILRLNNDAIDLIKKFNESNKIIAAICS